MPRRPASELSLFVPRAAARASWRAAQRDPGSTGGLLDAIASGSLGGSDHLPPNPRRIAGRFRSSVSR